MKYTYTILSIIVWILFSVFTYFELYPASILLGFLGIGFVYCAIRWWKHDQDEDKEIKDILSKRGNPTLPKDE